MILSSESHLGVILPMSGRISSSTIAGIRCIADACVAFWSSDARPSKSLRLSWRPVSSR
jgi:hypothetical protein